MKKLTAIEAQRVVVVANTIANRVIAGESLRLALPIASKMLDIVKANYDRIEKKYGEV